MTVFWFVTQAVVPMQFRSKPFALLRLNGRTGTASYFLEPVSLSDGYEYLRDLLIPPSPSLTLNQCQH
jgi:hypothetical protein